MSAPPSNLCLCLALATVMLLGWAESGRGQGPTPTLDAHVMWSRFSAGSSATLRTVSFDPRDPQAPETISETETRLVAVLTDTVQFEVRITMEVAGKRFEAAPTSLRQDFLGRGVPDSARSEFLEPVTLRVGLRQIPCQVVTWQYATPSGTVRDTIYFHRDIAPHVFRHETVKYHGDTERVVRRLTETVVSLRPPCRPAWGPLALCYEIEATEETSTTTIRSRRYCSQELPGAVYYEETTEVDRQGRCIRHSRSSLVRCTVYRSSPTATCPLHLEPTIVWNDAAPVSGGLLPTVSGVAVPTSHWYWPVLRCRRRSIADPVLSTWGN